MLSNAMKTHTSRSRLNRRDFLKASLAATAATVAGGPVSAQEHPPGMNRPDLPKAKADAMILIWLPGGLAQTDFWDAKGFTPFEVGMPSYKLRGTSPAIDTTVDGIRFGSGLESVASVMDKGALVRTLTFPRPAPSHPMAQFRIMCGYDFPSPFKPPSIGAIISRTLGPRNPLVPANIHLGRRMKDGFATTSNNAEFIGALHGPGFYGIDHAPLVVPEPGDGIATLSAAAGISNDRLDRRLNFLKTLTSYSVPDLAREEVVRDYISVLDRARAVMDSPVKDAFDLTQEPYGKLLQYRVRHSFARGCLVARRLIEVGARYVQVDYPYQPFNLIDTHGWGARRNAQTKLNIGMPIAQLVKDLDIRGHLDRTLVVVMSEFGRTISSAAGLGHAQKDTKMMDTKMYGFHGHFGHASSALLFGGGIKRGFAYGETANENPFVAIDKPVSYTDFHATIFTALGIAPDVHYLTEDRPVYVTEDGEGKPIEALYA